ncbi:MAG: CRISPR-associated RAMP protein Csx10 [Acidobacteria bacterium]|nr:CRISPR-associated RAMP protein Csx10 [Acidobacteriota bacterium]
MRIINYRITLLEPTLVTALEGDPNEGVSFNYLPGSVLRGAVIKRYLRVKDLTALDAADANARRLFFDGTTRYLNGYPLDRLGRRSLPTPQSWQREKGNETDIFDFAVEIPDGDEKQWQGVGKPFYSLGEQEDENGGKHKVRLVQPDRHITVHTARTRRFGRAMPADKIDLSKGDIQGAVYRYEALAPGQTFQAIVLCDDGDVNDLKAWLTGEATLGGSRSGGYGRASFEIVKEESAQNWRETGGTLAPDVNGKLIIALLSDAVLRDKYGQFVVNADVVTKALSEHLGITLSPYKYPDEITPGRRAFLGGEVIGGFNRKWGVPLPQALAVRMGSVFVYEKPEMDEQQLKAKLEKLEAEGIGERRTEGFGRIAVNWLTEPELKVDPTRPTPSITTVTILSGSDSERLLKRMAERLLRQRLDERLVSKANQTKIDNPPHNSQLSRLRNIIRDELMKEQPYPERVREFLDRVRERNAARKQFERARIGDTPLLEWLEETLQITDESAWKSLLGFQAGDARKVGGVTASLTEALRTEYLLRLIDAVLARAAKERRKEGK